MNVKVMVELNDTAKTVARFRTNSDRANLNCNRNPQNSESEKTDEISRLGITQVLSKMKTYKNLYQLIYSKENLNIAFEKARKGKPNKIYVKKFEENLNAKINSLQNELKEQTYKPQPLKRFIIRDPKTRIIHSSNFRDRVVYHALVNIIEEIFDKTFIHDSYASRLNKGTHRAVIRFDKFKRKISNNGKLIKNPYSNNNVSGYAFKADIKKYFDNVNHETLLNIIKRKIKDEKVIWLIKQILNNYNMNINGTGMPLGNLTSQFFANVYLNELDQFVKHRLKVKYYIRYVDDFIILHKEIKSLENYKREINCYLTKNLKLTLHPDKSKIITLRNGVNFLGYRIFFKYKLLRVINKRKFKKNFNEKLELYKIGSIPIEWLISSVKGWLGYAMWANTYKFRKAIINQINLVRKEIKNI